MTILYNDSILPIGKYRGFIVQKVIGFDPQYIKLFNSLGCNNKYAISDETLKNLYG